MTSGVAGPLLVAAAYLAGSIPTGLLLARARGVNIRQVGSHNIGATNVARSLGKRLGVVVLLLDALKGAGPVLIGLWLGRRIGLPLAWTAAAGLAAILGHVLPVWLRFRGGKGVATALGVFLALDPPAIGVAVLVFVALYAAFRVASIGSLAAVTTVAVVEALLDRPPELRVLAAAGAAVIFVRHGGNIRRLLRRQENRV